MLSPVLVWIENSASPCVASSIKAATTPRDRPLGHRLLGRHKTTWDRLAIGHRGQVSCRGPTPHDLRARLVAAVPPPRFHLVRYFGVLRPSAMRNIAAPAPKAGLYYWTCPRSLLRSGHLRPFSLDLRMGRVYGFDQREALFRLACEGLAARFLLRRHARFASR